MRDLVDHGVTHLTPKRLGIAASLPFDRRAEQRDRVRQHEEVAAVALGLRDPVVQAEEGRLARGRIVLDDDLDVLHPLEHPSGQGVERVGDEVLEAHPESVAAAPSGPVA